MTWPTKKLGDCIAQFDRGISWSRKDEGGAIAVLRIPNIQEGHINLNDLKYISPKNGNGELSKNDIVMVASNGNPDLVGRSALVTEKEEKMRFASFLVRLRFDDGKLLSQYAHLFLLTPTFKRELRRKIATTSGIYNLRKEHIEKVKISLPPLKIQKQIVERLDKIVEAQKLNDELIQKSDELFQSLLHSLIRANSGIRNWPTKKLGEVCEIYQPQTITSNEILKEGPYKVFGANGVIGYYSKYNHENVEVLVTCRGATCGTLNMSEPKSWITGNAMVVRSKDEKVLSKIFLYYVLKHSNLSKTITGTGQPQITRNSLSPFQIPLPPLAIQKQIVAKLSAVQDYKKQLLEQKAKLKELFNSALAKSFSEKSVK